MIGPKRNYSYTPRDKISSGQLRKLKQKSNHLVTVKLQKKRKKTYFPHFSRLGESDPYADKKIVKSTNRAERLVILPKKSTRSHKNHAYNQLPVLLIGTERILQKAAVICMYYITANGYQTWFE